MGDWWSIIPQNPNMEVVEAISSMRSNVTSVGKHWVSSHWFPRSVCIDFALPALHPAQKRVPNVVRVRATDWIRISHSWSQKYVHCSFLVFLQWGEILCQVNDQSKNKTTMKRRIVDVLQNDGDLLSQPQSGRCSRMTLPNSPAKQIRADQSPMKLAASPHANGPSTSSYGSAAIAHSGGSKSPIACKSSEPMDATRSSDGEFDGGWNKIAGSLLTRRLQLNRSIYNMEVRMRMRYHSISIILLKCSGHRSLARWGQL
jgi:hypothetical protein